MRDETASALKARLVDAFARVPIMQEADGRALVIAELSQRGYDLDTKRYSRDRHDIWAITSACIERPGALTALDEVLTGIEGHSFAVSDASRIIGQIIAQSTEAQPANDEQAYQGVRAIFNLPGSGPAHPGRRTVSSQLDVQRDRLTCGPELGAGARGRVYGLSDEPGLVYKEYISPYVDGGALAELILYWDTFDEGEKRFLDATVSWPLARVVKAGRTVGSLLHRISDDFYIEASASRRLAFMSFLCYPTRPAWADIGLPGPTQRIEITRQIVKVFELLRRHDIVVGDVSAQNILWAPGAAPRIHLLGCDSWRRLGAASALPEGETPGWQDPHLGSRKPDLDSDSYKIALLVGRILAQNPRVRPGETLQMLPGTPEPVARAVRDCFHRAAQPAGARPVPHEWMEALSLTEGPLVRVSPEMADGPNVLPIYIVCDVSTLSGSFGVDCLNQALAELGELAWNPQFGEFSRVCIVTYSDDANVLLPLSDISVSPDLSPVSAAGEERNYIPALRLLTELITADTRRLKSDGSRTLRPVIFFISGGVASDDWSSSLAQLVNSQTRPDIIGWGPDHTPDEDISALATKAVYFGSDFSPSNVLREIAEALVISDIQNAIPRPAGQPLLEFKLDPIDPDIIW